MLDDKKNIVSRGTNGDRIREIPFSYLIASFFLTLLVTASSKQASAQNSFEEFNRKLVRQICSGDTNWLRCFKQDPFACERISAKIVDKCVTSEVTLQIVPGKSVDDIPEMAGNLDKCIKKTFKAELEPHRVNSRECHNTHF